MPEKNEEPDQVESEGESSEDEAMEEDAAQPATRKKVYISGVSRPLKEGEEWDFDPEAYRLFHSFETTQPCLSFDTLRDELGENRSEYPLTCFLVAGTQGSRRHKNEIIIMKLSNLLGIHTDEDEEDEESDDDEEEKEKAKCPKLHSVIIPHQGGINRIKATVLGQSQVCAVWNDMAKVQLWNLTNALGELGEMDGNSNHVTNYKQLPLFSFLGHKTEGYALAWSDLETGTFASGDNRSNIYIWKMGDGGQWVVNEKPFAGHSKSVEDIQWSPTEAALLVSVSSDGSLKLWDTRSSAADACVCTVANAHESDVNVVSWNKGEALLATGGDDAALNVWSLKTIQYGEPVGRFKHHKSPITSVEWCSHESTTMMASGEDDQVTIWDIAVEAEAGENIVEIPPQLLFVHMGQQEIKEVHFHRQIPGLAITTALSGFNVFRTINL